MPSVVTGLRCNWSLRPFAHHASVGLDFISPHVYYPLNFLEQLVLDCHPRLPPLICLFRLSYNDIRSSFSIFLSFSYSFKNLLVWGQTSPPSCPAAGRSPAHQSPSPSAPLPMMGFPDSLASEQFRRPSTRNMTRPEGFCTIPLLLVIAVVQEVVVLSPLVVDVGGGGPSGVCDIGRIGSIVVLAVVFVFSPTLAIVVRPNPRLGPLSPLVPPSVVPRTEGGIVRRVRSGPRSQGGRDGGRIGRRQRRRGGGRGNLLRPLPLRPPLPPRRGPRRIVTGGETWAEADPAGAETSRQQRKGGTTATTAVKTIPCNQG